MALLHIADSADWHAAASGEYRVSTRGAMLDQVGFIHASSSSQVAAVAGFAYADSPATLVVLVIDEAALREAGIVVRYQDGGNGTLYPHIFGALRPEFITEVRAAAFIDGQFCWVRPDSDTGFSGTIAETDVGGAVAAELALLDPAVRSDHAAIDRLLAPGFGEIGHSGRLRQRAELLGSDGLDAIDVLASSERPVVSELEARVPGVGLVLLSYRSSHGDRDSRRSSLWRSTPQGWRIEFHQGTPL